MYTDQKTDTTLLPPTSLADATFITASRAYPATPAYVRRLWAVVTAAVVTANSVITFYFRPTPGSATGQVTIGTLTLPLATAAGKMLYKNVTPVKVTPGGELVVSFSGGSGAGGIAAVGVTSDPSWESDSNNTNAILSA